jgi:hypothetical protein
VLVGCWCLSTGRIIARDIGNISYSWADFMLGAEGDVLGVGYDVVNLSGLRNT